ncbi:MAG: hypothetical protein A2583_09300 [Bdellovibrionales bacterium RIFOXYD1_FULL_53_11]|nr:MAG: hypothetical protein A2583_09300 [Bdellovibrionales bacterium RIFOXYD1_FULL_53_11]
MRTSGFHQHLALKHEIYSGANKWPASFDIEVRTIGRKSEAVVFFQIGIVFAAISMLFKYSSTFLVLMYTIRGS